jgi:ribosomal protein S18 acetylase RimI-like enzyme
MSPSIAYRTGTQSIDWPALFALYDAVGLTAGLAQAKQYSLIREAFERSARVITAWDGARIVGAARLLTDGICYGWICDVGVLPDHQGRGIGKGLMDRLMEGNQHLRLFLTSAFGKEGFYRQLGFRRHKSAMALFPVPSEYLE